MTTTTTNTRPGSLRLRRRMLRRRTMRRLLKHGMKLAKAALLTAREVDRRRPWIDPMAIVGPLHAAQRSVPVNAEVSDSLVERIAHHCLKSVGYTEDDDDDYEAPILEVGGRLVTFPGTPEEFWEQYGQLSEAEWKAKELGCTPAQFKRAYPHVVAQSTRRTRRAATTKAVTRAAQPRQRRGWYLSASDRDFLARLRRQGETCMLTITQNVANILALLPPQEAKAYVYMRALMLNPEHPGCFYISHPRLAHNLNLRLRRTKDVTKNLRAWDLIKLERKGFSRDDAAGRTISRANFYSILPLTDDRLRALRKRFTQLRVLTNGNGAEVCTS
jgi:hypothetical protein